MIKFYALLFALVVVVGSLAIAAPLEGTERRYEVMTEEADLLESFTAETLPEELEDSLTRAKRATCQIPIIGDWVSDSACAAGCIARGRAGGHCRNEICHCREEMMLDLLRKRFNF